MVGVISFLPHLPNSVCRSDSHVRRVNMASVSKTVLATGFSSGLGFEVLRQLLDRSTPYNIIFGARDREAAIDAVSKLQYDDAANAVTVLPLELSDMKTVRSFAQQVMEKIGPGKIDYLVLNAAIFKGTVEEDEDSYGSRWCEAAVVNHFSHHYLIHLLQGKLVASKTRIVMVSSAALIHVEDPDDLDDLLQPGSGFDGFFVYAGSKFVQLLGAHWWRRQLQNQCVVIAVSPGLVPNTGLGRERGSKTSGILPDAKSARQGAANILKGLLRDDLPEDPDRIFLTSRGEWWDTYFIRATLDRELQNWWCPSQAELDEEAGIS
ncbi:uncharacterized protein UV8b_07108 [Ustilaginoidea virens]|uniref:Short-chain dehydrogenase/reductase SDR n=1 Tax=Ustilaginoidea virens TaxID=1159556 RepID=A0A8E5MKN5_USTVR|nr:uncharacterized protein UV8b_07108 [Ustilaginoidea virens]QUC22867.1 hypothetical protein UV8b_07108 [Ustilaginoidea virens]